MVLPYIFAPFCCFLLTRAFSVWSSRGRNFWGGCPIDLKFYDEVYCGDLFGRGIVFLALLFWLSKPVFNHASLFCSRSPTSCPEPRFGSRVPELVSCFAGVGKATPHPCNNKTIRIKKSDYNTWCETCGIVEFNERINKEIASQKVIHSIRNWSLHRHEGSQESLESLGSGMKSHHNVCYK